MGIPSRGEKDLVSVFIASFEVRPRVGAEMHGKAVGGFTYCLARAETADAAVKSMRRALDADSYDVADVEWVRPYEECEWETSEEQDEYDSFADDAERTGEVVYGPFYTYAADDA